MSRANPANTSAAAHQVVLRCDSGSWGENTTVTAQMKAVRLETGATVNVPTFVKEGDTLKIDTRTGTYVERVTKK